MSDDETIGHSSDQYSLLGQHMENYNVEASALHRKLQSKTDALRILRRELERFRTERDQFKLMAETLQLRYSSIKRSTDLCCGNGNKSSVANLLHETRERNLKLTTEVETLKQKLNEMHGDIELLRQAKSLKHKSDVDMCKNKIEQQEDDAFLTWQQQERANFICHLEYLKKKNAQLAFDFKALIDEKEELTMERDAYKCKSHRLNHELLHALKANAKHPKYLDIDSILLENKYLHERLASCENELEITKQSMSKYKTMLESKRKKGIIKLASSDENILSHKQVKSLLESGIELPSKAETIQDLKSLCLTLLDNLNDKNLALSHQKKTNKILGTKIAELEQRLQMLSGIDTSSVSSGYSPTQLLLHDYCPSLVDSNDSATTTITKATNDTQSSSTVVDEPKQIAGGNRSDDDGTSSFSTESARSVLSSEYGGVINGNRPGTSSSLSEFTHNALLTYRTPTITTSTGDSCATFMNTLNGGSPIVSNAIEQERLNDLKDLPPDLAALVQQALHELDMREFETKVVMRDARIKEKYQPNYVAKEAKISNENSEPEDAAENFVHEVNSLKEQ